MKRAESTRHMLGIQQTLRFQQTPSFQRTHSMPDRLAFPRSIFFPTLMVTLITGTQWCLPRNVAAQDAAAGQNVPGNVFRLTPPTDQERRIATVVGLLMQKFHVSNQDLNDTISRRALDIFTNSLDPLKLYFYQKDIDDFARYANSLDDRIMEGDMSLAIRIFSKFIERVDQRVATAQALLNSGFDFNRDESLTIDPDEMTYPASPEAAQDRWRRQIKYALLDLKDEGKSIEEAKDTLRRRYGRYARRWRKTDTEDLMEMYLTAITSSFDPHSTYMAPKTLENFKMSMRLNLDGIGAQLREKDGMTTITRVIPGGAAAKHGKLMTDDVIVNVGQGESGSVVDIVEMPLDDVVELIRGKAGTTVRLGVRKGGVGDVLEYKIVRARIELEESAARGRVIEHTPIEGGPTRKVGYINLPSFYLDMDQARNNRQGRSSTRDVRRILKDFQERNVEVVVLDLSKNGGGSLTEAISLTGLFIDAGPVVQVKNSDESTVQYQDEEPGVAWNGPLVVLTSKFSASASEILAGAIRDYRRGIVVGDPQTHGKGTVQTLMDLSEQFFRNPREKYGALKVTLQQFYLPDGQSTQLLGVPADVVLPSITAKMDVAEGDLDYALAHDKISRAKHILYNMVPPGLLNEIREKSMNRIAQDDEFKDMLRKIELYIEQKERNSVSLNEEKFLARRRELDAQKEEEEEAIEAQIGDAEVYNDNFYNREVLNIASDYLEGLRRQNLAKAG
ncbi:MAG: carboxy terminal-processing peptidase [Planctomycetota bacterium]